MTDTFKAAVLFELNKPLEVIDIYHIKPGLGEVKVKMISSGLCGAQVNEISGKKGEDKYLPHFLGHEGYGEVVEIGINVKKVKLGDHVILHWRPSIGQSSKGVTYKSLSGIEIGAGPVTTFAEFTIVAENRCTKIQPNKDTTNALPLLGCAVSTAYGAITKEAKVQKSDSILIFGAGGLGMALIFWFKVLGINNVTVVDIHKDKAHQVVEFGAKFKNNLSGEDFREQFDVIFETSGVVSNIEETLKLSKKAGRIILIGQPKIGLSVTFQNFLHFYDEITIISSAGGRFDPDEDLLKIYKQCKKNMRLFNNLVSHKITLAEVNEGFILMKSPDAKRIVINFEEGS